MERTVYGETNTERIKNPQRHQDFPCQNNITSNKIPSAHVATICNNKKKGKKLMMNLLRGQKKTWRCAENRIKFQSVLACTTQLIAE